MFIGMCLLFLNPFYLILLLKKTIKTKLFIMRFIFIFFSKKFSSANVSFW